MYSRLQKEKAINQQESKACLNLLAQSQNIDQTTKSSWDVGKTSIQCNKKPKRSFSQNENIKHTATSRQKTSLRYNTLESKRTLEGEPMKKQTQRYKQQRYSIELRNRNNKTELCKNSQNSVKFIPFHILASDDKVNCQNPFVNRVKNNTSLIHLLKNKSTYLLNYKGGIPQNVIHSLTSIKFRLMTKTISGQKMQQQPWLSVNRYPNVNNAHYQTIKRKQCTYKPIFQQRSPIYQQKLLRKRNRQNIPKNQLIIE